MGHRNTEGGGGAGPLAPRRVRTCSALAMASMAFCPACGSIQHLGNANAAAVKRLCGRRPTAQEGGAVGGRRQQLRQEGRGGGGGGQGAARTRSWRRASA